MHVRTSGHGLRFEARNLLQRLVQTPSCVPQPPHRLRQPGDGDSTLRRPSASTALVSKAQNENNKERTKQGRLDESHAEPCFGSKFGGINLFDNCCLLIQCEVYVVRHIGYSARLWLTPLGHYNQSYLI